jgi:hypothetical protein
MTSPALPPWGVMSTAIQSAVGNHSFPEAWMPKAPPRVAQAAWDAWRMNLVAELAAMLWPTYDMSTGAWSHAPDPKLIELDFSLMLDLHDQLVEPIKGHGDCSGSIENMKKCSHRRFFDEEDNGDFGVNYERYDRDAEEDWRANLPRMLISGMGTTVGSLHYQLKREFQRPRAYQVALMQNRTNFEYLWAASGGSPSFVSGHCLQGSMGGCYVFAQSGGSLSHASIEVFKQFTVDVGDRRVFAGVHYLSDNLASWYTALKLIPHVFDGSVARDVQQFLYEAITTKSDVYAAIVDAGGSKWGSPYYKAMVAIEGAGLSA